MSPALGVVIPTVQGGDPLVRCLRALLTSVGGGGEAAIVVVDNGAQLDMKLPGSPTLVRFEENVGFAAGVNAGVAALDPAVEWVAIVNDDVEVDAGWFDGLRLDGLEATTAGVASEVRFDPARSVVNSRGIGMSRSGWVFDLDGGRPASTPWAHGRPLGPAGSAALYRRSAWDELGGLDERFFAYYEDVDLAWRLASLGWTTEYRPAAVAFHRHSATSGQRSPFKAYLVSRNRTIFRAKSMSPARRLLHLPAELLRELLYAARDLRHGVGRSWARGKLDAVRMSPAAARAGRRYRASARRVPHHRDPLWRAVRRKWRVDRLSES
jgi:GT2 family glycosyltransferase